MADFGKVAVGVRVGSAVDAFFFHSWTRLLCGGLRDGDVVLPPAVHVPHSVAANMLVERFLASDADSLCFIDDDMTFEPDALGRLRSEDGGCDVLSALCLTRRWPFAPAAFIRDGDKVKQATIGPGIAEVDVVGLAFTLVRRSRLSLNCFKWDDRRGEDGLFCDVVRGAGGKVGVNPLVEVGHRVSAIAVPTDLGAHCQVRFAGCGVGEFKGEFKKEDRK